MPTKSKNVTKPTVSCKPLPLFLKPKPIKVVTKAVLNKIADSIHNPETGDYLNLCRGTLQNGPDPVCEARQMHCGLGELYFVVTGRQPEEDDCDEGDVIDLITDRSTIGEWEEKLEKQIAAVQKKLDKLDLPQELRDDLLQSLENFEIGDKQVEFEEALNEIPNENDQGVERDAQTFKARAKRVAAQIRKAAELLPR